MNFETLLCSGNCRTARISTGLIITLIVLVGAVFRFTGIDWDQGHHLHPDERFLTMVETALKWPASPTQYFDETQSPLNPRNVGHTYFTYGTLVTTLVKGLSIVTGRTGYHQVYLVGRFLSALFDLGTIVLVFLCGLALYRDRRVALLSAFFLSTCVLSIQHAHFFVVDSFATFFITAALFFLLRVQRKRNIHDWVLTGIFWGFALACKVSMFSFGAPILVVGVLCMVRPACDDPGRHSRTGRKRALLGLGLCFFATLFIFRIAQPDAFLGPELWQIRPSPRWLENMRQIRAFASGVNDWPPGHQWAGTIPLWFPLKNMILWGMGPLLGLTAWTGCITAMWRLATRRQLQHLIPLVWVLVVCGYMGLQFAKTLRYFLPAYPALVLLAAWFLVSVLDTAWQKRRQTTRFFWMKINAPVLLIVLVILGTLCWTLAFSSIYRRPHTRVQASTWIYDHILPDSTISSEIWDDALPLPLEGRYIHGQYPQVAMAWFEEDTPQKFDKAITWLDKVEYIILSSNRVYGSVVRLPMRFPMTIRYYESLFSGELGFEKIAEFTSYPTLFGLRIPDQSAEEAFTVYDHPKVQIFRKTERFNTANARRIIGNIDWDRIAGTKARDVGAYFIENLMLDRGRFDRYRKSGTWSKVLDPDRGIFDPADFPNRAPVLTWFLALECLALLVFPLLAPLLGGLEDNGWLVSKTLSVLLVAWGAWALSSIGLSFNGRTIGLWILCLGAASVISGWYHRRFLARLWCEKKALIVGEELLFFTLFMLFLQIRLCNPDLWHPFMGGEKPMDFAYLNAVIKTDGFPPYNPWFSEGYINYYYFGFVLVALLVKLTGIVPHVAYNLAVPTFFALTGAGVFTVTHTLVRHFQENGGLTDSTITGRRELRAFGYGVWGVVFVCVLGNLGEIRLLFAEAASLSHIQQLSPLPFVSDGLKAIHGLFLVVSGKAELAIPMSRYYWDATRAISHLPQEVGPISEFPFFTFLYGDLHAHLLGMPLFVLVMALGVQTVFQASTGHRGRTRATRLSKTLTDGGILFLLSLSTGALWPTNAWDAPTGLLLIGLAILYREWNRDNTTSRAFFVALRRFAFVIILGRALFLPYFLFFNSAYGSFAIWRGSRTPLTDYLTIHGLFVFLILSYVLHRILTGRHFDALARSVRLSMKYFNRLFRLRRLTKALVQPERARITGLIAILFTVLPATLLFLYGQGVFGLSLILCGLTWLLLISPGLERTEKCVLTLILVGSLQSIFVEVFVLTGDIGRMNTVFKFYLQIWVIWGISGAVCLALFREKKRSISLSRFKCPKKRTNTGLVWTLALYVLLACSFSYTLLATWAKCNDRFVPALMRGLDGRAFMKEAVYSQNGMRISLKHDLQAIIWIQRNIKGSPVILEAEGPLYSWTSRISVHTGLPTVIGWDWHQRQQMVSAEPGQVAKRIQDVRQIYSAEDPDKILPLLRKYHVSYIYVGPLETIRYPQKGIEKFKRYEGRYWASVYRSETVSIYKLIDSNSE